MQLCSPAVSRGNESCNTNSPSASPVTVVRKYFHTCVCAVYSNCGYYSRETSDQRDTVVRENSSNNDLLAWTTVCEEHSMMFWGQKLPEGNHILYVYCCIL